jgi:hypothetical protein
MPESSARAAIQLEALGNDAIPILKSALTNASAEVRFYAAEALAYLGDETGAEELATAARDERAFRVYAFAALAALDEAISYQLLRELLDAKTNVNADTQLDTVAANDAPQSSSMETRYGAFRALWTLDKNDPFIRGRKLNDQFNFHILQTEGEPLIHLTRHRLSEIVLFGADQRFSTPLALTAGSHISVNAPPGSETITISRFELGKPDQRKVVSTRVADVILTVAEMGGTYPDVAQMLAQADRQFNVPGRIAIDALPRGGRVYYRTVASDDISRKPKRVRVGKTALVPNLFPAAPEAPNGDEDVQSDPRGAEGEPADENGSGEASLADVRDTHASDEAEGAKKSKSGFRNLFHLPGSKNSEPSTKSEPAFEVE